MRPLFRDRRALRLTTSRYEIVLASSTHLTLRRLSGKLRNGENDGHKKGSLILIGTDLGESLERESPTSFSLTKSPQFV